MKVSWQALWDHFYNIVNDSNKMMYRRGEITDLMNKLEKAEISILKSIEEGE